MGRQDRGDQRGGNDQRHHADCFAQPDCVGLGLSNVVPVLFTAAGRTPGVAPGTGIAAVASCGYFGFLLGPPLIGFVAQASSLGWGLGVVVLLLALIAPLAGGVGRADAAAAPTDEREAP